VSYAVDNITVIPNPSATSEIDPERMPVLFYPNPFASSAIISTSGMKDASSEIYDQTGKLVSRMENISGHEFIVDRKNLLSGIYFYRLMQQGKKPACGKFMVE
jgi:hypothetical protein